jgi:hypothetical protein
MSMARYSRRAGESSAHVLIDKFGRKRFTDTTHTDYGLVLAQEPRMFDSFDEAAAEAAVASLYGGIHFPFDNDARLASGQCIGQAIHDRVRFYKDEDSD